MHVAVPADGGNLIVQLTCRFLVAHDAVIILLILVFVQAGGIEAGRGLAGHCRIPWNRCRAVGGGGSAGGKPGRVRNLKIAVGQTAQEVDPACVVQDVGQISERLVLIRVVMNRAVAGGRIFNAQGVVIVAAVNEVIQFPLRAAEFKAWANCVVTAAVDFRRATVVKRAALGLDVHDARRAEAILRGQRAGDELHRIHETRIKLQSESRYAFRQQHVVDAILQIRVLAAHMQFAARRIVPRHARRAQDDLAHRRVAALRFGFDLLLGLRVGRRAQVRRNLAARLIQLADNRDVAEIGDVG